VTSATTAFALHSNGRLIMLDQAGNERVRQQLQSSWFTNPSNINRDVNASVAGSMQGDALTVTTVTIP
jgi:hypothetical protein